MIDYLVQTKPTVGDKFLSDHELARVARLSRPTVRRALDRMHREGWIERRQGLGTFIGPRAAVALAPLDESLPRSSRRVIRLALMIHLLGDFSHDWYSRGVIEGIDSAAEENGISIELLGNRDGDSRSVARRLMQTRPDVLAFVAPSSDRAVLVAEGRRLDIPCIGTGTFLPSIGVPSVHEDNNQGLLLAVQHLVERGHRRIGFVQMPFTLPWVFLRRQAYINALEQCGIEPDEGLVLWLTADDPQRNRELLEKYLDRRRPTALVFGNHGGLMALSALIRSRQLRVPQDVSTIHVDQHPSAGDWLGVRPTCVSIPTQQMGRHIAALARQTIDGRDVPQVTQLPCELTVGASVASLSSQSDNGEAHEENHKT